MMKKQFKDDLERIQKQNNPKIDQLIEKNVRKHRRIRHGRNILISFSVLLLSFTALVNYHERFYVYAQSNPYLKKIAETVRFKDIFEESESNELGKDHLSLKEPFAGEIQKHQMKEIITDSDGFYFAYHHSQNNTHYFLKFLETEGIYDPVESVWRYDEGKLVEVMNLQETHLHSAQDLLKSVRIDNERLYLTFAADEKQYLYVYNMKNKTGGVIDEAIYMNVFYQANFIDVMGEEKWYLRLNEFEGAYAYELCSIERDESFLIGMYEGEQDPYDVPILRLIDVQSPYFLIQSLRTDRPNWEENSRDLEVDESYQIINQKGEIIYEVQNVESAMFKEHLLIYQKHQGEELIYGSYDMVQNKTYETSDVSEFYYHLREEGLIVFALTGEEAWFKNIKSSSPHLRTNLAEFTSTQDELEARYFIFPDTNPYYIVLDDQASRRIEIHEITFQ